MVGTSGVRGIEARGRLSGRPRGFADRGQAERQPFPPISFSLLGWRKMGLLQVLALAVHLRP